MRVLIGAALTVLVAVTAFAQSPAMTPQDIKGWRGAEWGMSPDQVAEATRLTLGAPELREPKEGPALTCRRVQEIEVGNWTANARFCFSELGNKGLISIALDFGDRVEFGELRDELAAKYGLPISETTPNVPKGAVDFTRAKWLLPITEITCEYRGARPTPTLLVTYSQRVATGL
jgi:hypothetical protein